MDRQENDFVFSAPPDHPGTVARLEDGGGGGGASIRGIAVSFVAGAGRGLSALGGFPLLSACCSLPSRASSQNAGEGGHRGQ